MITGVQILIDADNLDVPRLRLLVAALEAASSADVVIAGALTALEAVDWLPQAQVLPASGWQGADLLLARAYRADGTTPPRPGTSGRRESEPIPDLHWSTDHHHRSGRRRWRGAALLAGPAHGAVIAPIP
jgi:hypothetical protein